MNKLNDISGVMINIARLLSLLVYIVIFHSNVNAADIPTLDNRQISAEKVEAKIKEIDASTTMNDDARAKLIETYRKSITYLEQISSYQDSIQSFKNARENANKKAGEILKKLDGKKHKKPGDKTNEYKKIPLSELDQILVTEKANNTAVKAKLDDLEKKQNLEIDRPNIARQHLISAQQQQQELETKYDSFSITEEDPDILDRAQSSPSHRA